MIIKGERFFDIVIIVEDWKHHDSNLFMLKFFAITLNNTI